MRKWSLRAEDPHSIFLAADARLTKPSYVDDQIWELVLTGGEPAAVAAETTYGRRAQLMRIFTGFGLGQAVITDPNQFYEPPVLRQFYPNYARITFAPFPSLSVEAEYWVPESQLLVGRLSLVNQREATLQLWLRLFALLQPKEGGERMGPWQHRGSTCLAGRTENLEPVMFIGGGGVVDQAVYPAMRIRYELPPGARKALVWSHAGLESREASFAAARDSVARNWDAEVARIELINSAMLDINTGNPDWDAVLAFSQCTCLGSYVGPTQALPRPSFVLARVPDQGWSREGSGKDYDRLWDGQALLQGYPHFGQLMLIAPALVKGVIHNFLAVQKPDGSIDGKPGMGGQQSKALSPPLLGTLTWQVYQKTGDRDFLETVFSGLLNFFEAWFSEDHDRDQDGYPEWDHSVQMGFDDCPSYVRWREWGQGLDISKAETPDLASYLYRESLSLIHIAEVLDRVDIIDHLQGIAETLHSAVAQRWSPEEWIYRPQDRDTHFSTAGEELGSGEGAFLVELEREFDHPVRILIRSHGDQNLSRKIEVFIHGRGQPGRHRVERLRQSDFQWFWGIGTATSDKTYLEVERIEVRGLSEAFQTEISVPDFTRHDVTCLLPLWAGMSSSTTAQELIRKTLLAPERFYREYGIVNISAQDPAYSHASQEEIAGVHMLWNTMLAEGLIHYGFRAEAAELFGRLMTALADTLRKEGAFREVYSADQGGAYGARRHLSGIAPTHLFMRLLGVDLRSPREVKVEGFNPFPWPVRVRWRGLEIFREEQRTKLIFPNGQEAIVDGDTPRLIRQEGA
jgi:hypothetical protein